ncbi:MAG: glycosyltransferase family A protein [Oscillatoria sp. PMC 1051.18]|nr:glycosyltransferase family A protein [Oscillatoria sp. PMC 1050.18]MEC5031630.1 glycosyltransferase family A protein [Oscillatoria sp. PMC 1051.18]
MQPLVSVIIPAYNAESTILETIQSVQQQSYTHWEIIVVDDGSRDRTLTILQDIVEPRLQIFSGDNAGAATARNRGLKLAQGEFIAFLDADDLWTTDKLQLQLEALEKHPEAGVAYSWASFIDANGKFLYYQEPVFYQGNVYQQMLLVNFLVCGSIPLIRKQAIESVGEFNSEIKSAHDWDFGLRLAAKYPFVLVPKYQTFYRQFPGSISANIEAREKYSLLVVEKAYHNAGEDYQYLKPQTLANIYQLIARLYLDRQGDSQAGWQAINRLAQASQLNPKLLLNFKFLRLILKSALIQLLPPQLSSYLVRKLRQFRAIYDTKIKASSSS